MSTEAHLELSIERINNTATKAVVSIKQPYIESIYNHVLDNQQNKGFTHGFEQGKTPRAYLEQSFRYNTIQHLKEFFFSHCVFNFLYKQLVLQKNSLVGEPIMKDIALDPSLGASYTFELTNVNMPLLSDWKKLPFKAPTRKNYKDLDRQVEFFIQEEQQNEEKYGAENVCKAGDWILFSLRLIDKNGQPLLDGHSDLLWLRLGDDIIDRDAYEIFLGKTVNEEFTSTNDLLQEYINNTTNTKYIFLIKILMRVPHDAFSLDQFKKHFKLKTAKETHSKLIEVFSCRNDISQRRETVESLFKLLIKYYPFDAPDMLVSRQYELILRQMQSNPDYHVYKMQPDFKQKVKLLAEKQVKEHILISHLSCDEQIQISDDDIVFYLNLIKRPRTKEFIYFDLPSFKAQGHETPIPHALIGYYCLHEKTLNHLINNLIKRA